MLASAQPEDGFRPARNCVAPSLVERGQRVYPAAELDRAARLAPESLLGEKLALAARRVLAGDCLRALTRCPGCRAGEGAGLCVLARQPPRWRGRRLMRPGAATLVQSHGATTCLPVHVGAMGHGPHGDCDADIPLAVHVVAPAVCERFDLVAREVPPLIPPPVWNSARRQCPLAFCPRSPCRSISRTCGCQINLSHAVRAQ